MKRASLLILFYLWISALHSQQIFIDKISVDYTKTVSWWPLAKELWPEWFDQDKDHMPKEVVSIFNFTGDSSKSIYKRIKEPEKMQGMWYQSFADENVVYNDYTTESTIIQKPVYETTFLMQDSMLKIKWKLTPDTRNIAGFNCRKAIGIIFDTVAVFAFYAEDILINGGPEGIHGLPGMILGIGIPRLHTTWFATKINISDVNMKMVVPATKGKKTNRSAMISTINSAMKSWDQYGQKMLLAFII